MEKSNVRVRETQWFEILNFINGLVAPSFIFISGFVFLVASQRKLESFRTFGSDFRRQLWRIGLVMIIGYYLHLPFFSFRRMMTETTESGWLQFYQSDVLQCIAVGLFILFMARIFIRSDQWYKHALLASAKMAAACLLLAGTAWGADRPAWPSALKTRRRLGIQYQHSFGARKLGSLLESTGAGCVWFDYNNDGLPDLYVHRQAARRRYPSLSAAQAARNPAAQSSLSQRWQRQIHRRHRAGRRRRRTCSAWPPSPPISITTARGSAGHRLRPRHTLSQQRQRHVRRRHRQGRMNVPGWSIGSAWLDYDRDGWSISSSAAM